MMSSKIPKTCLDDIQRLQRKFIWGDTEDRRKYHAVSWKNITTPKWMGGLGLRNLEVMNQACLIKLVWKLSSGAEEYWCNIMRSKYADDIARLRDSNLWKVLASMKQQGSNNCPWIVEEGLWY
jgi:hypothetical protein